MALGFGPHELQARGNFCRSSPEFQKLPFFPNLNSSPNGQNGSVLQNSKCHMDRFSMPFTHLQSDSDFVIIHFSPLCGR